ncbi:MAG: hypothetical protein ACYSTS_13390 [Planctomycetota bacterium]|jgi:hypothetical protein
MGDKHVPPFKGLKKRIDRELKKAFQKNGINYEDIKPEDFKVPLIYAIKRKVIRQELKRLESKCSWFRKEYKNYLIPDKEIFSNKQWVFKNKKICENLARKRNSKLLPLLNYLCNHKLSWRQSESLAEEIDTDSHSMETKKGQNVERTLVLVIPDYEDIEKTLKMSLPLIRKYLQGMTEAGFIKALKKSGSHGQKVYAVGYYLPYEGDEGGTTRYKANWFLTGGMKEALMEFKRPD